MIGFLTHPHHRYTQVFDWLLSWFPESPQIHYGDSAGLGGFVEKAEEGTFDAVCLFQLDACLPYLATQTKVICCPMYDASRNRPADFFPTGENILYVNMCRRLHQSISAQGGKSLYYQYAPDPKTIPTTDWEKPPRAHFWEREPGDMDRYGAEIIARRLGCQSLDFRLFRDKDLSFGSGEAQKRATEQWGSHAEHLKRIAESQIFIAPRRFEGIGMAFLEAMAMGCVVVAENQATANEYILHGSTGLLYAGDGEKVRRPSEISKAELNEIGLRARDHIAHLHRISQGTSQIIATKVREFLSRPKKTDDRPDPILRKFCWDTQGRGLPVHANKRDSTEFVYRNKRHEIEASRRRNLFLRIYEGLIRPKRVIAYFLSNLARWAEQGAAKIK